MHDIRSPAQSLTLLADLLTEPDGEVEEILRDACGHLGRTLELLSRVIHPAPPGDIAPFSVRESLTFIADLHHSGRTPSRLELTVDPSLQAAAGIERHFEHALLNLVLNSTDALRTRESGLIDITARNAGDQVEISVSDNGVGIPPDLLPRLFETPITTKSGHPVAGIGLIVARELLRLSGGTLTQAEEREPGARFVITLPAWRRGAPPAS